LAATAHFSRIAIIGILKYKDNLKKVGENIVLKRTKKMSIFFIIVFTIFAVASIIALIITKEWIYIIPFMFFLYFLFTFIQINIYSNINGLYENGLISNEYTTWAKIHSYKWINENTISFSLKTGNRIDFENILNKEKINDIIFNNKIAERR
jgi:hypothetical protein